MENRICCLVNCGCYLIRIRKPVWVIDLTPFRGGLGVRVGWWGGGWLGACETASDKKKSSAPCLN